VTCQELADFLMAYLDLELPPDVHRQFEDHIDECPPCLAYLDSYRETVRLGQSVCGGRPRGAGPRHSRLAQELGSRV
jgi:anti-sigma factor RsiW